MQREPQLVLELLREQTAAQSLGDAPDERLPVRSAQGAMLQPAAHHRPRTSMPEPFCFGQDEIHAALHRERVTRNKVVRQRMEFGLGQGRELSVYLGAHDPPKT